MAIDRNVTEYLICDIFTFPRATAVEAISNTKQSSFIAGAPIETGFVPITAYKTIFDGKRSEVTDICRFSWRRPIK